MRILIGNHIDDSLLAQQDMRMFVQRIFWFVQEGDIIILPCPADEEFLHYVLGFVGIRRNSLNVIVMPSGCFGERLFDPLALLAKDFLKTLRGLCQGVTEIFPLWPSPQIARFARALGLTDAFPGAGFFLNGGDELANSKAHFRAFAASLKCQIPPGAVSRTRAEAESVMRELLEQYPAVVIKQIHNGGGAGNQIVYLTSQVDANKVGMRSNFDLAGDLERISEYLDKRWDWATCKGRFPVAIESYIPGGKTVYAEFYVADDSVLHLACGALGYTDGNLVQESTPLRWLPLDAYNKLVSEGQRLAEFYRQLGYRGYLSADALYDKHENIWFTEVNARIGGSPHIYQGIANRVVHANHSPYRIVTQFLFNPAWELEDTRAVLQAFQSSGLAYQPETRRGALLTTPPIHITAVKPFLFCIIHEVSEDPQHVYDKLNEYLLGRVDKPLYQMESIKCARG
jgi:hypothetical protein